jgi:hypothetical protein
LTPLVVGARSSVPTFELRDAAASYPASSTSLLPCAGFQLN